MLTQKEKQKAVAKKNRDASSTPWGWLNCPICLEGTLGRYRLCLESVNSPPSWSHHWQSVIPLLLVNHCPVPPQTGHCAWCSILTGQNWSEMSYVGHTAVQLPGAGLSHRTSWSEKSPLGSGEGDFLDQGVRPESVRVWLAASSSVPLGQDV